MALSTLTYKDITVRLPLGADIEPLQTVANSMGWMIILGATGDTAQPKTVSASQLRGIFRVGKEFDYKSELHKALCGKYDISPAE